MNTISVLPGLLPPCEPEGSLQGIAPPWDAESGPAQTFHYGALEKEEPACNTPDGRQKLLLTVEEAATTLSLGRTFVYELVMRGDLASIKIGNRRRIPVAALEAFVTQHMAEQNQQKGGS